MNKFEIKAYGMGLNKGMLAKNSKNEYISPITMKLLQAYKQGKLTAILVNSLVQDLK
jgi:ribosomal protein L21E